MRSAGGERPAHIVDEYAISAVDLPATASYVALGHLHRAQAIAGATSIHYCGSPLQLDFGERAEAKQVNVVDLEPGLPAKVTPASLTGGEPVCSPSPGRWPNWPPTPTAATCRSTPGSGRVVAEPSRAGLADEVREALGGAVWSTSASRTRPSGVGRSARPIGASRTPSQQFAAYLSERDVDDPRLQRAFELLHDELTSPDDPNPDAGDGSAGADAKADGDTAEPEQLSLGT